MARWQVDAAVLAAFALSPKMSHLEVARRIAFLLSNPLPRLKQLVDVRRLRGGVPLWAINLCVVPTLTFKCLLASELRADV